MSHRTAIERPTPITAAQGACSPTPKDLYEAVKDHVKERLPTMPPGKARSLKQICCPDFWLSLSAGECRLAGQYVAVMVICGELQLVEKAHSHEYPKKYCPI